MVAKIRIIFETYKFICEYFLKSSMFLLFRPFISLPCGRLEAKCVGVTAAFWATILVEATVALATVVAQSSLPVVEVSEHLWLLRHAGTIPVRILLPHLRTLVAPYALVVVGEGEGDVTLHLHAYLYASLSVAEYQLS